MVAGLLQNGIYRKLLLNVNFLSIDNDGRTHPKRSQVAATLVLAALLYLNEGSSIDRWVVGGTVLSSLIKTSQ